METARTLLYNCRIKAHQRLVLLTGWNALYLEDSLNTHRFIQLLPAHHIRRRKVEALHLRLA